MAGARRERTTLDLRGLGPAIRAQAQARNTTVAALARMAVVRMLERSGVAMDGACKQNIDAAAHQVVKVTLRMPRRTALEVSKRARAAGVSHGAYLSTLLDGAPMLLAADERKEAVTALAVSTDQLAQLAADLNAVARLVRRDSSPAAEPFGHTVATLTREVQAHLHLAARLMVELKPPAARQRDAGSRIDAQRIAP